MTDQNSQFFAILTAVGEAKQANANALGVAWTFAQMGVGDANNTDPVPSRTQTKLINERRRAPLNQLSVDPKDASIIIAEQVIPPDVGGWWIREIGLYDAAGDLVAVANCAPSYKPLLAQGTGKTQVVRLNLVVTSTANVQLKIDPAVVLATRQYVDDKILEVLPGSRPTGTFNKVTVNARGVVTAGENPTTLAGHGILDGLQKGYIGLGGKIAQLGQIDKVGLEGGFHSFTSGSTTFGNYVSLLNFPYLTEDYAAQLGFKYGSEEPTVLIRSAKTSGQWGNVRTLWHSGNLNPADFTPIKDSYVRTQIDQLLSGKANLASPTFIGTPRVPNAVAGTSTDQAASTKFVMDAMAGKLNVADAQMTGVPTCSTANLGTNNFQVANTEFVQNTLAARVATQVQVNAGTDDSAFVTSSKLRWGFNFIKGGGYGVSAIVFPSWLGGLMIQWGSHQANSIDTETTVNFPLGFSVIPACVSTLTNEGAFVNSTVCTQTRLLTATGFQSRREDIINVTNYPAGTVYIRWLAVGY